MKTKIVNSVPPCAIGSAKASPHILCADGLPAELLPPHPAGDNLCVTSSPVQYNNGMVQVRGPAPDIGQHTAELLQEPGLAWDQITRSIYDGVIH